MKRPLSDDEFRKPFTMIIGGVANRKIEVAPKINQKPSSMLNNKINMAHNDWDIQKRSFQIGSLSLAISKPLLPFAKVKTLLLISFTLTLQI